MKINIADTIFQETQGHPDKIAVIDRERQLSYADLLKGVQAMKDELLSRGVSGHKKVALYADDSMEYIIVSLAVLWCEGVIVPVSPSLAWDQVQEVIERIDVHFLITAEKIGLDGVFGEASEFQCKDKGFMIYQREVKSDLPKEYFDLGPAFIRFSSGTTSESKGVVLSHRSIIERTDAANKGLDITPEDNIIWVLSMGYHFVVTILLFLRKAATIILCGEEFPAVMLESFDKYDCTLMYASPVHYRIMMSSIDIERKRLASLRMAISTAVGFTEKEIARFFDTFGVEISEAFGIIEVGLPFINLRKNEQARGSVGKILPDYQVQIRDQDEQGVGVIHLKGKGMFDAYYSPWRTRAQILDGDWFNTGDLGSLDKQGFLFIKGREKNIINYAGMKIFPAEVEAVLNTHPNVHESFVYGVPHDVYGQLPQADVVLKEEAVEGGLPRELRKFCYINIAAYQVPKEIRIVQEIRKTGSGKILRTRI